MIIDIHGHYTTAPKALEAWRNRQIAAINSPSEMPKASELHISDDELRESIESNQLRLMRERGLDLTIFSPRASFMAHHIGDFADFQHVGGDLQRAVLSREPAVSRSFHPGRDAAAKPGRGHRHLHSRARQVRASSTATWRSI